MNTSSSRTAQGYNPSRVSESMLAEGGAGQWHLIPRKYIGDWLARTLTTEVQVYVDGPIPRWGYGGSLGFADPNTSHRTILSNAQLGRVKERKSYTYRVLTTDEVKRLVQAGVTGGYGIEWMAPTGDWRQKGECNFATHLQYRTLLSASELAGEASRQTDPQWRRMTPDEVALLRRCDKTAGDSDEFSYSIGSPPRYITGSRDRMNWMPGCPYFTTLSPEELRAKYAPAKSAWRTITESQRRQLADLVAKHFSKVDHKKFRHSNVTEHQNPRWGFTNTEGQYTTSYTEAELASILGADWRPITDIQRNELKALVAAGGTVDDRKFRFRALSGSVNESRLGWQFNAQYGIYETLLTEAELAALLLRPVQPSYRDLTEAEKKALSKAWPVPALVGRILHFTDKLPEKGALWGCPAHHYKTDLTEAGLAVFLGGWRRMTAGELKRVRESGLKTGVDFRWIGERGQVTDEKEFKWYEVDAPAGYETTLSSDELRELTERTWRPLTSLERYFLKSGIVADSTKYRVNGVTVKTFVGSRIDWDTPDIVTSYTEREFADLVR